ncbi:hypothetical protein GLIP_2109 [Aliiglaciecola lipolytica E3]|uniref:Uncharacterized protein n=1 Tax=Aliiglaciecola lipolytica E3 TaxID=1127673 RepID=K6Y959_9ALTE|nr:hypothetical protein GLIP_2109 [Aliiglaciecola lipolytica E3]
MLWWTSFYFPRPILSTMRRCLLIMTTGSLKEQTSSIFIFIVRDLFFDGLKISPIYFCQCVRSSLPKNTFICKRESEKPHTPRTRKYAELIVKAVEALDLFDVESRSDEELRKSFEDLLPIEKRSVVAKYLKSIEAEEVYYWEYTNSFSTKGLQSILILFKYITFVELGDLERSSRFKNRQLAKF